MPVSRISHEGDKTILDILRGRHVEQSIHFGPNMVHAFITHEDGTIDDLGVSQNLLTTASATGRDFMAAIGGGLLPTGGSGSPFNGAPTTTSFTATGTPWTTNLLAGMQAIAAVTGVTTAPVHARIISNTTSVATIEGWYTADGTTLGTTPATTNGFIIVPGGPPARFMALTENAGAASASDTSLTGEITSGGCGRSLATYAHTLATATYTLQKAFSVTGTFPAIHKMGIFPFLTASGAMMVFESVLNADASVVNGDTLTVTDTVTVS